MYQTEFEHSFDEGALKGSIRAEVLDPHGHKPPTIIQRDHVWQINVAWSIDGSTASTVATAEGQWLVVAYLEGVGYDWEREIGQAQVPVGKTGNPPYTYECLMDVPPAQVLGQPEGIYRLTIAVTFSQTVDPPYKIAAFVEGLLLKFYDP